MNRDQHRSTPSKRPWLNHLAVAAWVGSSLLLGGWARGQNVDPNSLFGRDSVQSVFVRDSAVAVEKFALAGRMEHLKEWDKAGDVYQDILKTFADRVVPSQVNKDNKIYQYTSVVPAVQERLAKWPQEGLDVYRGRYEGEAAAVLENAHDDLGQLHKVFSLYFITDSSKKATTRLIDLYIERGEFAAAAWLGDRLLSWHPSLKDDEPKILYRTALALQLSGNAELAQQRLATLKQKFPAAASSIRGTDVILADSLSQILGGATAGLRETSPDSWPIAFGNAERSRVPQVSSFGGARLFNIELPKGVVRTVSAQQRKQFDDQISADISGGVMTGILPVVDHGELFFQDNARIYAVSLESGMPLPGWTETYEAERNGRYTLPDVLPFPRSQQCTVTVTDDSVYAVMGLPDVVVMRTVGGLGLRVTKLVCLDRTTGKQKWIISPKNLPEEPATLRSLDLSGSPLVIGDTVYIQARGGKGAQFEDSYVLAFEAATGAFKWASYIASANSTANYFDGSDVGALFGQNVSHLAYSSGRLYALTNLGAVAAIDAYDGTAVWLDLYNRQTPDYNNPFIRMGRFGGRGRLMNVQTNAPLPKPWTSNPVMVSQGKVFVLPSDADDLYIYDAGTGKEFKRIPMRFYDNADTVVGIADEKLVINSDRQVYCINWQTFDENDADRDKFLIWRSSPIQRPGAADASIRGRGLITADSVIIPTAWQLYRISLSGGKLLESYPPGTTSSWAEDEGPGNIVVTQDRLIVAGPTASGTMRVSAYTDLTLAMRKLDADVAAAPDDAAPRLRYAEVLFVAGKVEASIGRLDEAIAMITGKSGNGTASGVTRERVFNTVLTFAEKLAKEKREGTIQLVSGLYDRAALAAVTPSQKVHYRLSRASAASESNQPEQEIKLYQQILQDPELRTVSVSNAEGDDVSAASEIARIGIDSVLRRTARSLYDPYEAAASKLTADAVKARNPDQLQDVAMIYPNALAAPQALLSAAEIYEAANNPRGATQVLRIAYFRYPDNPEAPRVLETMARNYLRMPGRVEVAAARLRQAGVGRMLTKPLVMPDGAIIQNVSLGDAADRLAKFTASNSLAEIPDLKLPVKPVANGKPFLPEQPQTMLKNIGQIVPAVPQFTRNDHIITYTEGAGIRVFPVGSAQPNLSSDALTLPPKSAAWIGDSLLAWNQYEIALIGSNGMATWKTTLKALPQLDVVAQGAGKEGASPPVDVPQPQVGQANLIINGQQVMIRPGQQGLIVNGNIRLLGGPAAIPLNPNEQIRPANEEVDKLHILTDRIVFSTTDGRLIAMSQDHGKVLWQTRINDRMPLQLLASDDFVVSHIKDNNGITSQITVLDTFTGQALFRQNYGSENVGVPTAPVNLGLSPDGMLISVLPSRIEGRDLFNLESKDRPKYVFNGTGGDMGQTFANSSQPNDLVISGDRFFVVGSTGTSSHVWMRDVHNGTPIAFRALPKVTDLPDAMLRLNSNPIQNRVQIRTAGPMIYIANAQHIYGFDLSNECRWDSDISGGRNLRDLVITSGYVLAINDNSVPGRAADAPIAALQMHAYSRAMINGTTDIKPEKPVLRESGLYYFKPVISANPILGYQVVQGGLYYLSANHELHFLPGAGAP